MLTFDESALQEILRQLPRRLRVAFAAACAQRLSGGYTVYHARTGRGDPEALGQCLRVSWDFASDPLSTSGSSIESQLERCMSLVPRIEDEPLDIYAPYAEDAGSAVAYSLRASLCDDPREAAWAARRAIDGIRQRIIDSSRAGTGATPAETAVLSHELMRTELEQQAQDMLHLRALCADPEETWPQAIKQIETRAAQSSARAWMQ